MESLGVVVAFQNTRQADHIAAVLERVMVPMTADQLTQAKEVHKEGLEVLELTMALVAPDAMDKMRPVPAGSSVKTLFAEVTSDFRNFQANSAINVGAATLALSPAMAEIINRDNSRTITNLEAGMWVGYCLCGSLLALDLQANEAELAQTHEGFLGLLRPERITQYMTRCKAWWQDIVEGDHFRHPPPDSVLMEEWRILKGKLDKNEITRSWYDQKKPVMRRNESTQLAELGLTCLKLSFTPAWPKVSAAAAQQLL